MDKTIILNGKPVATKLAEVQPEVANHLFAWAGLPIALRQYDSRQPRLKATLEVLVENRVVGTIINGMNPIEFLISWGFLTEVCRDRYSFTPKRGSKR